MEKIKPTKLQNVFNVGSDNLSFDVNLPQFLKEACENCNGGMYAICYYILKGLLAQVAERAIELNDPVLNTLMIRLNLYDLPNNQRYPIIRLLKKSYDELVKSTATKKKHLKQ